MRIQSGLFTSESVSDGHPDKIADQISDAILDACLEQDPASRVAVETAIKSDILCLMGEITTSAAIDPDGIARQVLRDIGHEGGQWGVDPDRIQVIEAITKQASEIASGVNGLDTGAGDQGLMFGYACDETRELMPLPISLAHTLMMRHAEVRRTPAGELLGPDAKSQVTVRYENGSPIGIDAVVLSTQHLPKMKLADLREFVRSEILEPVLGEWLTPDTDLHINPSGTFHMGGPVADAGLTGRKIIVDTYGGYARHGGGAFSGKDATKVDRSAAYAARQLARDTVSRGWATSCEVRVAYAIGVAKPVAVDFEAITTGSNVNVLDRYSDLGIDVAAFLRPSSIIERLDLCAPIFRDTATYGHFGHAKNRWEMPLLP